MKTTAIASTILTALIAACGASEPADTSEPAAAAVPSPTPAVAPSGADHHESCRKMFVRQRECGEEFLPALVDLRVRLDVPAGIAEADRDQGRQALLATARREWAADSTDEAIAARCDQIVADNPPETLEALEPRSGECLAHDSCQPFVDCALEIIEGQMAPR